MMQVIVYQRLEILLQKEDEKLNDYRQKAAAEREKIAAEREKNLEHHRQSAQLARLARYEWAIAYTQWWTLLLAFAAGVIVAAPLWLNWPALVGCDRHDLVCTIGRIKEEKWVRD